MSILLESREYATNALYCGCSSVPPRVSAVRRVHDAADARCVRCCDAPRFPSRAHSHRVATSSRAPHSVQCRQWRRSVRAVPSGSTFAAAPAAPLRSLTRPHAFPPPPLRASPPYSRAPNAQSAISKSMHSRTIHTQLHAPLAATAIDFHSQLRIFTGRYLLTFCGVGRSFVTLGTAAYHDACLQCAHCNAALSASAPIKCTGSGALRCNACR